MQNVCSTSNLRLLSAICDYLPKAVFKAIKMDGYIYNSFTSISFTIIGIAINTE